MTQVTKINRKKVNELVERELSRTQKMYQDIKKELHSQTNQKDEMGFTHFFEWRGIDAIKIETEYSFWIKFNDLVQNPEHSDSRVIELFYHNVSRFVKEANQEQRTKGSTSKSANLVESARNEIGIEIAKDLLKILGDRETFDLMFSGGFFV